MTTVVFLIYRHKDILILSGLFLVQVKKLKRIGISLVRFKISLNIKTRNGISGKSYFVLNSFLIEEHRPLKYAIQSTMYIYHRKQKQFKFFHFFNSKSSRRSYTLRRRVNLPLENIKMFAYYVHN